MVTSIFLITAIASILMGIYIYKKPLKVFEFQRKFYEIINWRIEPISMEKEIRNTKIMGAFVVIFVLISTVFYFLTV